MTEALSLDPACRLLQKDRPQVQRIAFAPGL